MSGRMKAGKIRSRGGQDFKFFDLSGFHIGSPDEDETAIVHGKHAVEKAFMEHVTCGIPLSAVF